MIDFYAGFDNKPTNDGPALFAQAGFKKLAALDELEAGLRKLRATS